MKDMKGFQPIPMGADPQQGGRCLAWKNALVDDGTAATTQELHEATVLTTHNRYATVVSTDEAIVLMNKRASEELVLT